MWLDLDKILCVDDLWVRKEVIKFASDLDHVADTENYIKQQVFSGFWNVDWIIKNVGRFQ